MFQVGGDAGPTSLPAGEFPSPARPPSLTVADPAHERSVYRYFDLADAFVQILLKDPAELCVDGSPSIGRAEYRRMVLATCMPELEGRDVSSLESVICGGSAVPEVLSEGFRRVTGLPNLCLPQPSVPSCTLVCPKRLLGARKV